MKEKQLTGKWRKSHLLSTLRWQSPEGFPRPLRDFEHNKAAETAETEILPSYTPRVKRSLLWSTCRISSDGIEKMQRSVLWWSSCYQYTADAASHPEIWRQLRKCGEGRNCVCVSLGRHHCCLLLHILGMWKTKPLREQPCQYLLQVWGDIYSTIIPETPMPRVFPEINQDYYGVISLLKCTFRITYLNQYVSSSTQRSQQNTRITNAFFLDQLIPFYICLSSLRFVKMQSSIYSIGKTILDKLCKYTFSLGEEWNSVVESKKIP